MGHGYAARRLNVRASHRFVTQDWSKGRDLVLGSREAALPTRHLRERRS